LGAPSPRGSRLRRGAGRLACVLALALLPACGRLGGGFRGGRR